MHPPEALLLVSPQCQYCKGMHTALDELVTAKALSTLTVVDIAEHPEVAEKFGVRSVPWLQMGGFVFEGAHTPGELEKWIKVNSTESGWSEYLGYLLENGKLALAEKLVGENPERLLALVSLAEKPDTPMQVRIGIAAIFEGLQGTPALKLLIPEFAKITESPDTNVRSDACHYLSLTGSPEAIPIIEKVVDDEDLTVREIATESLQDLKKFFDTK